MVQFLLSLFGLTKKVDPYYVEETRLLRALESARHARDDREQEHEVAMERWRSGDADNPANNAWVQKTWAALADAQRGVAEAQHEVYEHRKKIWRRKAS